MILAAPIKLAPTEEQFAMLLETLAVANRACNWLSEIAWGEKIFQKFGLQRRAYFQCREVFALPAQTTIRCLCKVAEAYSANKRHKASFKKFSGLPYDARTLRFVDDQTISIVTSSKRVNIRFIAGQWQRQLLKTRRGHAVLIFKNGHFFLNVSCKPDKKKSAPKEDFLGIDLGIVNLASDSRGRDYEGDKVDDTQRKFNHRRRNLQKKQTRSAKRKLKKISGKQKRFQRDINHCISKAIVADAKRYQSAIALEDLKGIRKGVKARKRQRARLHNWGFYQLQKFIEYKAELEGIPVVYVDPKNTSRHCPECGHLEKKNRKTRDTFKCVGCGFTAPADTVAARNIRARAVANQPMVADAA